jgi:hypothetical protein
VLLLPVLLLPVLLAGELLLPAGEPGSEMRPKAFASTILPRPPTVTTTSPRLATTVCSDDCAGEGLWSSHATMPAANAAASASPRSVWRGRRPNSPIAVLASIPGSSPRARRYEARMIGP